MRCGMRHEDLSLEHPDITRARLMGLDPMSHDSLCPICGQDAERFYFGRYGECLGCCECVIIKDYDEI